MVLLVFGSVRYFIDLHSLCGNVYEKRKIIRHKKSLFRILITDTRDRLFLFCHKLINHFDKENGKNQNDDGPYILGTAFFKIAGSEIIACHIKKSGYQT